MAHLRKFKLNGHLFTVLSQIKTNFCLSDDSSFFHIFGTFSGKYRQNQGKLGAAAVNGTVAALFLCPQQRQNGLYFLSFFAQIKNSKKIAS